MERGELGRRRRQVRRGARRLTRDAQPVTRIAALRVDDLHLDGDRLAIMPFGLEAPTWDVVATEALQPGDRVLLYTDGIVEGRNGAGAEFDLERLTDLLERELRHPEREILRRVVQAVLHWQEGKIRDDATLVLLHWLGPRGSP